ncbi:MAG TPA: TetR/AcrR family transcriptional regulator [Stellaceae bacterium]|jgi:AcrR family transcriptional regulator
MARRSDHSREELERIAVDAAVALIAEAGFENFSARQVAARIGYTIGTIYNVFGDYDNLLLQAHARTLDAWYAFLQDRLTQGGDTDPLRALAAAYVDFARTHFNSWRALFANHRAQNERPPEWYAAKLRRLMALAEDVVLPHVDRDPVRARRAAQVIWAGIHGLCILSLSGKLELVGAASPETLADALIVNYLRGEADGEKKLDGA